MPFSFCGLNTRQIPATRNGEKIKTKKGTVPSLSLSFRLNTEIIKMNCSFLFNLDYSHNI
jgi:hypothetical protein